MFDRFKEVTGVLLGECRLVYRIHATQRMFERDISGEDVRNVLHAGWVIEKYGDDYPFPSVLACGADEGGRMLHVVASFDPATKIVYIITTYIPSVQKWGDNFTRRRTS